MKAIKSRSVYGTRPSTEAAMVAPSNRALLQLARERHAPVASGEFGADMRVALVNDGPVTIPMRIL